MKNTLLFISFLIFFVSPTDSYACSVFGNKPAKFQWSLFSGSKQLPTDPTVEFDSIIRGGDMGDSCNDVAILVIAIPIDTSNPAYAYKFELVSGYEPAPLFRDKPILGALQEGKQTFAFSWIERKAFPLDFVVKVTAYSRSGKKGGSTTIKISAPGR